MCQKIKTTEFFMWPVSSSTDISSFYYSDINLFLNLLYLVQTMQYMVAHLREQLQEYHYTGGKTLLQFLLKTEWQMTIWKDKLKIELCILVDYSYQPEFFNILAIGQKYLSFYQPSFFNIDRVINFQVFLDEQFFSWLCRVYT